MQALARGRKVEQWLGPCTSDGKHLLKWVFIEKDSRPKYSVVLVEVLDTGEREFDWLFPLDPDEPQGKITYYETKEEALNYVIRELGGSPDYFVREGTMRSVYDAYLKQQEA